MGRSGPGTPSGSRARRSHATRVLLLWVQGTPCCGSRAWPWWVQGKPCQDSDLSLQYEPFQLQMMALTEHSVCVHSGPTQRREAHFEFAYTIFKSLLVIE